MPACLAVAAADSGAAAAGGAGFSSTLTGGV
jgi:hypothetical protein